MRTLLEQIPIDRVLYASNYPVEERGKSVLEGLRGEFLTEEEFERVGWGNAERLFGLKDRGRGERERGGGSRKGGSLDRCGE